MLSFLNGVSQTKCDVIKKCFNHFYLLCLPEILKILNQRENNLGVIDYQWPKYNVIKNSPYTLLSTHFTLHTSYYTLLTTHYTLNTTLYTLHTTHYTIHNTQYPPHLMKEDREQRTEDRWQRTEDRGQRTEDFKLIWHVSFLTLGVVLKGLWGRDCASKVTDCLVS